MRNMLEHPITQAEVVKFLDDWLERWDLRAEKPIGSPDPFIAEALKRLIVEQWDLVREYFEIKRRGP